MPARGLDSRAMSLHQHHHQTQSIQREIVSHWQLRHPNVLRLIGIYYEEGSGVPMMLVPFMKNGAAFKYLKKFNFGDGARFSTVVSISEHADRDCVSQNYLFRFMVRPWASSTCIHSNHRWFMATCMTYARVRVHIAMRTLTRTFRSL